MIGSDRDKAMVVCQGETDKAMDVCLAVTEIGYGRMSQSDRGYYIITEWHT